MLFTRTFLLIEDVRHVSERYIAKSDPYIVMVSTPNAPDGLFEKIDKEPEDTCIYKRLKLDYTYGLGKIYTVEEIDKAKQSPSFEREYNLKYLGLIGNVFHTADMERTIKKGKLYDPDVVNGYTQKSIGLDPGFGSSPFGVVIQNGLTTGYKYCMQMNKKARVQRYDKHNN
jgi:hypothetical protein